MTISTKTENVILSILAIIVIIAYVAAMIYIAVTYDLIFGVIFMNSLFLGLGLAGMND